MKILMCLNGVIVCALVACGGGDKDDRTPARWQDFFGSNVNAQPSQLGGDIRSTPVTLRIDQPPVPVKGSDGRFHVAYEIELTNYSGDFAAIRGLSALDARSGAVVASLDAAGVGLRLVVRDRNAQSSKLGPSQTGLLYVHAIFETAAAIPQALAHQLVVEIGTQTFTETGGRIAVAVPTTLVLDAPLRGSRFIAGDGCCDSMRHVRASLPINGEIFTAQRFAIDWEQLDALGRIYVGDPRDATSYVIYGKPVHAVADGQVVAAVDGLPDTPPGGFPENLPIEQADGNHVILALGEGQYALFAHLKPDSVRVRVGDFVRSGDVLGLVGTSGNSSEPHLHFHVTDGPSALASNGVPYLLRSFSTASRGVSTTAFDQAILDGQPIPTELVRPAGPRASVLPLDLLIVDF